jgi:hypothetical protein
MTRPHHRSLPYPTFEHEVSDITEFIVLFTDGKKVKAPIDRLPWLQKEMVERGISVIRRIIFQFNHRTYHRYYYPYAIHNIVIERYNTLSGRPLFSIQFYHYYNTKNERIDIPPQQQYYDYWALEQFLYPHTVLYHMIFPSLVRPFSYENRNV